MGPEKMEYLTLWQNLQILRFTKKTYEKIVKWLKKWQTEKHKIVQSKKSINVSNLNIASICLVQKYKEGNGCRNDSTMNIKGTNCSWFIKETSQII